MYISSTCMWKLTIRKEKSHELNIPIRISPEMEAFATFNGSLQVLLGIQEAAISRTHREDAYVTPE